MKYPKLWNGSSPVGEALVRALQRTGAPFLNAHTADGVWAGKMGRRLSEVKQGGEFEFMTWQTRNGYGTPPSNIIEYPDNRVWAPSPAGRRYRPRARITKDRNPFDNNLILWHPIPEWAAGRGAAWSFTNLEDDDYASVPATMKFGLRKVRVIGAKISVGPQTIVTLGLGGGRVAPVYPATIRDPITEEVVTTQGFVWRSATETPFRRTYYEMVEGDSGLTVAAHSMPPFVTPGINTSGVCFRVRPNELRAIAFDVVRDGGDPNKIVDWIVAVHSADGRGMDWVADAEPHIKSLFYISPGDDPPWGLLRLHVDQGCAFAPTNDGEIVGAIPAGRTINIFGPETNGYTAFDLANTSPYSGTEETGYTPSHGLTLFKGPPGEMQVVFRLFIPGRAFEVHDSIQVSGARVVLIAREARRRVLYDGATPLTPASWFYGYPTILLYSDDHGETWSAMTLAAARAYTGALSVAADGDFLLPLRINDTEEDVPRPQFGVFKFRDPEGVWKLVGRIGFEHSETLVLGSGMMPEFGSVFNVARGVRFTSASPGQPWLSNDAITPPWETP